ncbi:alpha/beta hydrolase [Chitinophaga silvatica]|uniref:Alpha/beta hydrolase n=1 Tax=Chitinophaga silvatica TaxID=2282649 RepID=A0A3E1YEW0_9BACT|nr:alpha/beta hydrolase [Chitinophaga silvatica]RFS25003.1 alpha/beta hydrolase [Chitinophaga silvatica]
MQKHLYLISGLGADERIFANLIFPADYKIHYLPWISPLPSEPINQYAARMAENIQVDGPVVLLGVSFGGIMSQEIAKQIPVSQNILISSIKHSNEKPPYYKWIKSLGIQNLPDQILYRHRSLIVKRFLNTETEWEKKLVNEYLQKQDYTFTRWAVNTILNWENQEVPDNLIHIHGNKDWPFPIKYITPTHLIENAGHFMVLNRAAVINQILAEVL